VRSTIVSFKQRLEHALRWGAWLRTRTIKKQILPSFLLFGYTLKLTLSATLSASDGLSSGNVFADRNGKTRRNMEKQKINIFEDFFSKVVFFKG
jgi:hypothetical protein